MFGDANATTRENLQKGTTLYVNIPPLNCKYENTLPLVSPNHNHSLELDFRWHKNLSFKPLGQIYLEVPFFLNGSSQ